MRDVEVLGVRIDPVGLDKAVACIDEWIETGQQHYVCLVNVHVVQMAAAKPELEAALWRSSLNLPDGAPVAWVASRVTGRTVTRVTGSDLFSVLCRGHRRHFFFGSTDETLERLTAAVALANPAAEICGSYSPPFRPFTEREEREIADLINLAEPEIVWVGLGAPRQETWMMRNRSRLDAPVLAGVGAAFDFASGQKRRAPVWTQRVGLEWLHRLATEPRRLAGRYLTTNASFVVRVAAANLRFRERGRRWR